MIKVLNVLGGLNYGGIERVLANYAEHINREEFIYDFFTCDRSESSTKERIFKTGSNIYYYRQKRESVFQNVIDSLCFLKANIDHYDIIHVHLNYEGYLFLLFAKLIGYKIRICHSHTSFINSEVGFITRIKRWLSVCCSNYYAGCSSEANKFLYGSEEKSVVIPNTIDFKTFKFDKQKRDMYRKLFQIENDVTAAVLIGRMNDEKNHKFICEIIDNCNIDKLQIYFIGEGDNYLGIKKLISDKHIDEKVKLLGTISNISDVMNAFDVLILPSLHEGFPMVMIEAQANGMKCLVSTNVPRDTDISGNVEYLDLTQVIWREALIRSLSFMREDKTDIGCDSIYDTKNGVKLLEKYYHEIYSNK